ncbi:MAG: peptidase M23 [Gammaproteobacteria bacterium]|nr:MAG: peptidase M23 [Gammaproteobacteria bacterium]RKZ97994.1 MAG: peptidase M23 [Gammaproteobacteria bacterium]
MRIVLILLILALTACGGGSKAVAPVGVYGSKANATQSKATQPKTRQSRPTPSKPPSVYQVKKGDTLYSISWRYGMDYKNVAKINNIRPPYKIVIGQKIRFKSYKTTTKTQTKSQSSKKTTATKQTTTKKAVVPARSSNKHLTWRWPTKGKVVSTYSKSAAGRKGIKIRGDSGQSIVASASGKVVYSGNGLPRYGNLLIIKHNDVYLSAYAHNKKLLVKEGQQVKAGQKIATLGKTGTQQNQLHFEIRRNGKPVDPMRFLPKK